MKLSKRLEDEKSFVEGYCGERVICDRCSATIHTYHSSCSADLSDPCPGFMAVERARRIFNETLRKSKVCGKKSWSAVCQIREPWERFCGRPISRPRPEPEWNWIHESGFYGCNRSAPSHSPTYAEPQEAA